MRKQESVNMTYGLRLFHLKDGESLKKGSIGVMLGDLLKGG